MSDLRFAIRNDQGTLDVNYINGVKLGEFIIGDDGYYVFFPELRGGFWDQNVLSMLSAALEQLNRPWNIRVTLDLEKINLNFAQCSCSECREREQGLPISEMIAHDFITGKAINHE